MKPLVVNSEIESPFPQDVPSESTVSSRAMLRDKTSVADVSISDDSHRDEPFQGPLENQPAVSFWQGVGDVIGFPVRAVGWVIQSIF